MRNNKRLHALDTFRGLTIALMILVNSPGNEHVYPWIEHSNWNGCTLADLVFPFFLFIVGLSCSISLSSKTPPSKIIKRSASIFAIGLFLNAFPYHFELEHLRILGVLQRIAICYCAAAFVFLHAGKKAHEWLIVTLLTGYWMLMTCCSPTHFGSGNNLAAIIDQRLLGSAHLYQPLFDPEGLLSTIPAIATTLLGNLTGLWLKEKLPLSKMLFRGGILLTLGLFWSNFSPLNKTIWSSSYVLFTGGLALFTFTCLHWFIDVRRHTQWCTFFDVFGVNALAAYILHVFFLKIQAMVTLSVTAHQTLKLRPYLTQLCFGYLAPTNASLLYAMSYLMLWFLVLFPLYRQKIYLKL